MSNHTTADQQPDQGHDEQQAQPGTGNPDQHEQPQKVSGDPSPTADR